MNIEKYLHRIGVSGRLEPTLENLTKLQMAHLLHVPFENLDIHWGIPIELDIERLYAKIVERGRGGFCYELNGLFCTLLTELDYNVSMISARPYNSKLGEFGPEFDHMVLIVHLENDVLIDVGFGDSFRAPILLPGGHNSDVSGRYRVISRQNNVLELQRSVDDSSWVAQYSFTSQQRELSEYAGMCHFHQTSPDSHFRQQKICSIAKPWGRVSLSETSLITTRGGERAEENVSSEAEWAAKLQEHFGIEVPGS